MSFNINIDNTTLEILSAKLKHTVSPLDIMKWLGNFQENEIELAKDLLLNLTVYTTYEIEEILSRAFEILFTSKIPAGRKVIVNSIGEFGKSGSMITYFFQKTAFYKDKHNNDSIKLFNNLNDVKFDAESEYSLVMLDDFVGSGGSIRKYCDDNQACLKDFQEVCFVGIAGMEKGIRNIAPLFAKLIIPPSNIFKKAFSADASYFGYRKYLPYRNLSYKYGIQLSPKQKKIGSVKKYIEALGYENSQALVSFAYGSPNNTLPIFWANKNGWFPLIPRFSTDKINISKKLRKNISYELSILKEFGSVNLQDTFFSFKIKKGKKEFSAVTAIDYSIYGIIRLSREGFLPVNICQKLGIMHKDFEEYIQNGREKGIFDKNGNLTLFGLTLYQDAKKCIERNKKKLHLNETANFKVKEINYIPNQFNGRS